MKKILIVASILCLIVGVPVLKKVIDRGAVKKMQISKIENRNIISSIIASGNLSHSEKVLLSTEVIGKVKSIYVKEGDVVKKSQLLLQIEDTDYSAAEKQNKAVVEIQKIALRKLELQYANIKSQWKRKQVLYEKKLIDQQTYESASLELAEAELQVKSSHEALTQAEAQLEQSKNNLAKTRVYSPIDGIVTSLSIKVGETAIPGTMNFVASTLMTIADPVSLRTEVNVDEADISRVSIGQAAEVVAMARSGEILKGVVEFIAETAKVAEGRNGLSFLVRIRFNDEAQKKLWPGVSVRAEIFTEKNTPRMAVPIQAIMGGQDESNDTLSKSKHVFVVKNNRAVRTPVKTGISDDEYQEISGNLKPGEMVVLGPDRILRDLKDGDRVEAEDGKS